MEADEVKELCGLNDPGVVSSMNCRIFESRVGY